MKEYKIEDIIKQNISPKNMHTYHNENIYLSENQISVLNKYHIEYQKYNDIKQLMYDIETYLEQDSEDDLEEILIDISEFNYYHNIHK